LLPKAKGILTNLSQGSWVISYWYDRLAYLYREHDFEPYEICNWDETGFQNGEGLDQQVVSTR
jgi:hypothetical protein